MDDISSNADVNVGFYDEQFENHQEMLGDQKSTCDKITQLISFPYL